VSSFSLHDYFLYMMSANRVLHSWRLGRRSPSSRRDGGGTGAHSLRAHPDRARDRMDLRVLIRNVQGVRRIVVAPASADRDRGRGERPVDTMRTGGGWAIGIPVVDPSTAASARESRPARLGPGARDPSGHRDFTHGRRSTAGERWGWRGARGGARPLHRAVGKGLRSPGPARRDTTPTIRRGCASSRRAPPARSGRRHTRRPGTGPEVGAWRVEERGHSLDRTSRLARTKGAAAGRSAR
jgi:hypothetical protein